MRFICNVTENRKEREREPDCQVSVEFRELAKFQTQTYTKKHTLKQSPLLKKIWCDSAMNVG